MTLIKCCLIQLKLVESQLVHTESLFLRQIDRGLDAIDWGGIVIQQIQKLEGEEIKARGGKSQGTPPSTESHSNLIPTSTVSVLRVYRVASTGRLVTISTWLLSSVMKISTKICIENFWKASYTDQSAIHLLPCYNRKILRVPTFAVFADDRLTMKIKLVK